MRVFAATILATGIACSGIAGATAAEPLAVPDFMGNSGLSCLRGADALFDAGRLVYLAGVHGCRHQAGTAERVSELINSGGYRLQFVDQVMSVPVAKVHLPSGELGEILASEGLVAC